MIKCLFISLLVFILVSCDSNMKARMEINLKLHIQENDKKEGLHSDFKAIRAISYEKYNVADTVYLARIYVASKSWYIGGNRVYNTNDTLNVYFNKDIEILRMTYKIK